MKDILEIAIKAARLAGEHMQQLQGKASIYHKETSQNLVTQADLECEERITACIREVYPDHAFLLEEGQSTGGDESEHLWVVDPLDATNNYAHGIPHYSVSIAYVEKGETKVGVVLDPTRGELFTAVRGEGASLNGNPIKVTNTTALSEGIFATGFYYDRGVMMKRTLDAIHDLFRNNIRGIRRMGSAAIDLAWVACGRYEGFFEYQLHPWDYAAGSLLIEEAGGRCSDRQGRPLILNSGNIICSNGVIHEKLVEVVQWDGEG